MKKTLGLVMVLVMILTAISAFAAVPSKTTADLVDVKTQEENVKVTATENTDEAILNLLASLMADNSINNLPAEAKAVLPEDSTYAQVVEAVTLVIEGGTAEKDLIINLKFPTSFEAGKKLGVLLGVPAGTLIPEWKFVEGIGKDDGSVDVVLNGELQDWLNGREFIALVLE